MTDATFIVRDGARRKAIPCAVLRYTDDAGFEIDIEQDISPNDVPAFFVPFVERSEYHIPPDLSLRWVRERIPPSGRQNLGEVLNAHGLNEYSELALLRSGRGESSQDGFIVEEIDTMSLEDGFINQTAQRRKTLGSLIKKRREKLEMSQRELADAVGIDQPALSKIEAGKSNVTFDLLSAIDCAVSGTCQPMLQYAKHVLWNEQRKRIQKALDGYTPDLSQTYKRLIDELEMYDEKAISSIADSRIISHCFREIMDSFSIYIDEFSPVGMQGHENTAMRDMLEILEKEPLTSEKGNGVQAVSSELYSSLVKVQEIHLAGSLTNNQKMSVSVSGLEDSATAPISAWKEAHSLAHKTAHLPRNKPTLIPSFEEYETSLTTLENSIEVRIGSIYKAKEMLLGLVNRANRVDSSGRFSSPLKGEVQSFVSMLGDSRLRSLVFRELKNPLWLEELEQEDFFKAYLDLDENAAEPLHPEPFLSICLDADRVRVVSLLKRLSKNGWASARRFLIESAQKLPEDDLESISQDFIQWAKEGYGIGSSFWIHCNVEDLVTRMLKSNNQDLQKKGLSFFQQLTRLRKHKTENYPYEKTDACIPEYYYPQFVEDIMPALSLEMRITTSRYLLNQYVSPIDKNKQPLPTRFIAPSLEASEFEELAFHKKYLAPWINEYKKAVLDALQNTPETVSRRLFEQKPLVLRCIMSSLHEHIEAKRTDKLNALAQSILVKICLNKEILLDLDYETEIIPLLKDFAILADENDRERFLHSFMGWLDAWEREHVEKSSCTEKAEYYKREREYKEYEILSVFPIETLPDYLRTIRLKHEASKGKYSGPRQLYKVTTVLGPNSPLNVDELKEKGPADTLIWLREWEPSEHDKVMLVEHAGISEALTRLIEKSPLFFDGHISDLKKQKLIYISGIIDGWQNAVKAGTSIPIEDAISLCLFVSKMENDGRRDIVSGYDNNEDGLYQTMHHIAWFLVEVLESSSTNLPNAIMHDILRILLNLRSRGLSMAASEDGHCYDDDPVTASINILSSIALSGILQWIIRSGEKEPEDLRLAFATLEKALPDSDSSKADIAAFALKARGLLIDHRDWLDNNYDRLFGNDEATDNQKLFLALQISAFGATPSVFDFLKSAIQRALENGIDDYPETFGFTRLNGFIEHLGFYLYRLYAIASIELNDDLICKWNMASDSSAQGNVLRILCETVRLSNSTTDQITCRIARLWDSRANQAEAHLGILQGAFDLMASHLFPHEWLRKALLEEARSHSVVLEMSVFFDDVHVLASEDPEWGIKLLRFVIESDNEKNMHEYGGMPHSLLNLYRDKYGKEDTDDVRYCMNELGRMGILDLDLI